jgi:hypothetical protein
MERKERKAVTKAVRAPCVFGSRAILSLGKECDAPSPSKSKQLLVPRKGSLGE